MSVTSDLRFIREGDIGTLEFNTPLKPEYHVTPNKAYDIKVTSVRVGSYIDLEYTNDIGETIKTNYDANDAKQGYESIFIQVSDEVFDARVEERHDLHLKEMIEEHTRQVESWRAHCDNLKKLAKA